MTDIPGERKAELLQRSLSKKRLFGKPDGGKALNINPAISDYAAFEPSIPRTKTRRSEQFKKTEPVKQPLPAA